MCIRRVGEQMCISRIREVGTGLSRSLNLNDEFDYVLVCISEAVGSRTSHFLILSSGFHSCALNFFSACGSCQVWIPRNTILLLGPLKTALGVGLSS